MRPFNVEPSGEFFILRDDKIGGGTKRRGLEIVLSGTPASNIFYAGTIMGHGALALAHACEDAGKLAHIYICGDESDPMVQKLRTAGAQLYLQPPMPIATLHALATQHANGQTVFHPGFDFSDFESALVEALRDFDAVPYSEIWTTSVTGTLTRALKRAFPGKVFKTVSVVKSGTGDYHAPEKYHRPASNPPPYPACPYTDAKLWQFARGHAAPAALLWNVAG